MVWSIVIFQVKGTIFRTDDDGALVDIGAKSLAYLPVKEACIHEIKHVKEIGLYPGLQEEFIIIGQKGDVDFILSMRRLQYNLAWERCRQLHAENAVVKGKVGLLHMAAFVFISILLACNQLLAMWNTEPFTVSVSLQFFIFLHMQYNPCRIYDFHVSFFGFPYPQ